MEDQYLQTFNSLGTFTFTAVRNGLYKFHVIGSGGDGADGSSASSVAPGGAGGCGGGYGVYQLALLAGAQVQIEITEAKSVVQYDGHTVTATAGNSVPGTCEGANVSNLQGAQGEPGAEGSSRTVDGSSGGWTEYYNGGKGGNGAASVGKYQNTGGLGGSGAAASWATSTNKSTSRHGGAGTCPTNTDMLIGAAGGGGGGRAYRDYKAYGNAGAGAAGQLGGVVVELTGSVPDAPPWVKASTPAVAGKDVHLSWGAALDIGNDLAGYALERKVDSGAWTETYRGAMQEATDTVPSVGQLLLYRVKAYDAAGDESGYMQTENLTIIHNLPPTISGDDRDLGTMADSFAPQTYTVADEDGDDVTVEVRLDGVLKNSFTAAQGTENRLEFTPEEWRKVLNGPHTWTITATDPHQAAATRTLTFTKNVTSIRYHLESPMTADAMPEKLIMSFQGAAPEGSLLKIEACNNGFDASPAWEDITEKVLGGRKHFFENKAKTAERWGLDVRVSLDRSSATGPCYVQSKRGNYA